MGTVIVLGSLITDLVARAPRLPYAGEVLIGNEFGTFIGGKGLNAAIAAARSFVVQPVDATAAGDAFCGTLAACLAENMDMPSSLRTANAAGAITVTRRGAVPSLPTAAEIAALLRR